MRSEFDLQQTVLDAVQRRGYARGNYATEARQQTLKALEELGEVARYVFDGRAVPVAELADVAIPLLVLAALQGDDLLAAILEKAQRDVERGRRRDE